MGRPGERRSGGAAARHNPAIIPCAYRYPTGGDSAYPYRYRRIGIRSGARLAVAGMWRVDHIDELRTYAYPVKYVSASILVTTRI